MQYRDLLKNLVALTRVYEWMDKLQVNFLAALILLVILPEKSLNLLLVYGVYQCFLICYGYVINSYADRIQDRKVGKHLEISYFSENQLFIIFAFLAFGSLGIPLTFSDIKIKILGIITFILATFYSLKPIRFKERGFLGIIVPALTQRSLLFFFFAFIGYPTAILSYYLFGWLGFIGIIIMMAHQIVDFENDKKGGVSTWALKLGKKNAKRWATFTFVLMMFYLIIPIIILTLYSGLAISFILFAFSYPSISFYMDAMKT